MAMTENKKIDAEVLKRLMKEKEFTIHKFAAACGLGHATVERYMAQANAPEHVVRLFTLVLGVPEDSLDIKPSKKLTAAQLLSNDAILSEIDKLNKRFDKLDNDLSMMAKMLIQINKTSNETKAQAELNKDEITATYNKAVDISSNVAKIYGKMVKKY